MVSRRTFSIGGIMGAVIVTLIANFFFGATSALGKLISIVAIFGMLAKAVPGMRGLFGALILLNVLGLVFGGQAAGTTGTTGTFLQAGRMGSLPGSNLLSSS